MNAVNLAGRRVVYVRLFPKWAAVEPPRARWVSLEGLGKLFVVVGLRSDLKRLANLVEVASTNCVFCRPLGSVAQDSGAVAILSARSVDPLAPNMLPALEQRDGQEDT